jgi:hypothetical protein
MEKIRSVSGTWPRRGTSTAPGRLPPQPLIHPPGWFRTSSMDHNLDAFFAAVLARDWGPGANRWPRFKELCEKPFVILSGV